MTNAQTLGLLLIIGAHPGARHKDVCAMAGFSQPHTLTPHAKRLEDLELINRLRGDDGRSLEYHLAPLGWAAIQPFINNICGRL